jgi:hypothetical protein
MMRISKSYWCAITAVAWMAVVSPTAFAGSVGKTLRVKHGKPVICVSQKAVLMLEFLKEPREKAMIEYIPHERSHCRAQFHYKLYDRATDSETEGGGTVDENYRVASRNASGDHLEDLGSNTRIVAGEFSIGWSQGTAGARSWLYYCADSTIRFLQQPQAIAFDAINHDLLKRYLASENIQEFVSAGQTVQVIGPAVFSGDLPEETPVAARIESGRIADGAFEIGLTNLSVGKHYIIENSYELKTGNWNVVHSLVAREASHRWSDPLAKEVTQVFYRIRESRSGQ